MADSAGRTAVARQQTPDGYDLTVQSSLAAASRVLSGTVAPGYHTPATAFGPLKTAAEKAGKVDFTNLWAGQSVALGRDMPAGA